MDLQEILTAVKGLNLPPIEKDRQSDLDYYTTMASRLAVLTSLQSALEFTLATVSSYILSANKQHVAQGAVIKKILANPTKPYSKVLEELILPKQIKTVHGIEIAPGIKLTAIPVQTFSQVGEGQLYYVQTADHFALRLAGKLLHGNIGMIINGERLPEKIKDCRYDTCNDTNCEYYHDPIRFPGKKDHRNYVTNAWTYTPPDQRKHNRGRNLGSRQFLAGDLAAMTGEMNRRYTDQVFHDLLCVLLMPNIS